MEQVVLPHGLWSPAASRPPPSALSLSVPPRPAVFRHPRALREAAPRAAVFPGQVTLSPAVLLLRGLWGLAPWTRRRGVALAGSGEGGEDPRRARR